MTDQESSPTADPELDALEADLDTVDEALTRVESGDLDAADRTLAAVESGAARPADEAAEGVESGETTHTADGSQADLDRISGPDPAL